MFASRVDRLTSSLIRELLSWTQRPEVISFAGGLPAGDAMPAPNFTDMPAGLGQYGPTEGEPELRDSIARYLNGMGLRCGAGDVLVTTGSQQGLDLVTKLFVEEGTPVVLEAPSYLAAIQPFRLFGARFLELGLGPHGIDPDQLRRVILRERPAFVYLIPTFQNPAGTCYDDATRRAVARVLDETGVVLVEDEPYRELMYDPVDRTPISAYLERAPYILMGTFSKTGLPGLRIGYSVASPALYPHLVRLKQCTDLHSNRPGQWWCARFLDSPDFPGHLERLRALYRTRRDGMQAALERHFPELAEWQPPQGGLFFWLRLRQPVAGRELLARALERNVAFMPGEPFFAGEPPAASSFMRLNFSHADPERAEKGIAVLADVLASQPRHTARVA